MGVSRTVSEKFCVPAEGVPLFWNWVSALVVKKPEWWGYWAKKEVWRYLKSSGYNPPTWRTDRHRAKAKTLLTHSVVKMMPITNTGTLNCIFFAWNETYNYQRRGNSWDGERRGEGVKGKGRVACKPLSKLKSLSVRQMATFLYLAAETSYGG